jgi:hypothetical protein
MNVPDNPEAEKEVADMVEPQAEKEVADMVEPQALTIPPEEKKAPMALPIPPEEKKAPMAPEGSGQKSPPPSSKKKKGAKKPPREKNPNFKDLEETGAWGSMSRNETYAAIACFGAILIGMIVAVVVIVLGREDAEPEVVPAPPRATNSPTPAPTDVRPDDLLKALLDGIFDNDFTFFYTDDLPLNAIEYEGLRESPMATPQEKAMSWVLYEDEWEISADALSRWVMASIYFQMGGESWIRQGNWLSGESLCKWENVECEPQTGNLWEIDLQQNGLVGTIPVELALLSDLQSLWMRENELTGTIPGDALGSLAKLSIVHLDTNKLTGTIPPSLRNNGALSKYLLLFCTVCFMLYST